MKKEWYNKLPWISLFSGIIVIVLLAFAVVLRPSNYVENPVNRKIAYDKLKQIRIESKEAIYSKAFHEYFNNFLNSPVINTKWLVSDKGIVLYARGMLAQSTPVNSSIYNLIDRQSHGLLNAVNESLDTTQQEILYIAATIRREGDHNDVLGHIVMPLKTSSNEIAGFIGVAYEFGNSCESFQFFLIASITLVVCFMVYWLSLPLWVYLDLRKNNKKYVLWTIFVLIGNLPAYIAYLLSKNNN